jgi:hypothetical protein
MYQENGAIKANIADLTTENGMIIDNGEMIDVSQLILLSDRFATWRVLEQQTTFPS